MFETSLSKKRAVGSVLLVVILFVFLAFNRFPKLDIVQEDLDAVTGPQVECFQGFCIEAEPDSSFLSRWWDFSLTYFEIVAAGMVFAFVVAGLTEAFLFPSGAGSWIARGGLFLGTLKGLGIGPVMNLCSACIVPVTSAFRGRGAGIGGTVAMVQGSSTLNLPAILMALVVFTPMLGGSRIVVSVIGGLLIGPLVAMIAGEKRRRDEIIEAAAEVEPVRQTWGEAIGEASVAWAKSTGGYVLRIGPIMLIAGLASGLAIQWLGPDTVETYLGNDITGVAIAATLGVLINVPLLFEIPLVVLLLLLGMGVAPAATLLFAAAAGGPVTFWGLARLMPRRAIAGFAGATWGLGIAVGVAVLAIGALAPNADFGIRTSVVSAESRSERETVPVADLTIQGQSPIDSAPLSPSKLVDSLEPGTPVTPFTNVAATNLGGDFDIWNDRPGVAVFDYDRDGDLDFYVTTEAGNRNRLYRNVGDGTFMDVGEQAGVAAIESHSTGVVACDLNNDGFQDLYVGAWGDPDDGMDFRTPREQGNRDRLYLNSGDGSFRRLRTRLSAKRSTYGRQRASRAPMSTATGGSISMSATSPTRTSAPSTHPATLDTTTCCISTTATSRSPRYRSRRAYGARKYLCAPPGVKRSGTGTRRLGRSTRDTTPPGSICMVIGLATPPGRPTPCCSSTMTTTATWTYG